jgi:hypothetical protein
MAKEPSQERLIKDIRRILNNPFWIPEIKQNEIYTRLHDDHDGTFLGSLIVLFNSLGDAFIGIDLLPFQSLRYRTSSGGGKSLRVRNALIILALAIKLDNEENPINL